MVSSKILGLTLLERKCVRALEIGFWSWVLGFRNKIKNSTLKIQNYYIAFVGILFRVFFKHN